ncbi:hypothetical protein V8C86DRAFT_2954574, partial [Haematococcus lacustris]
LCPRLPMSRLLLCCCWRVARRAQKRVDFGQHRLARLGHIASLLRLGCGSSCDVRVRAVRDAVVADCLPHGHHGALACRQAFT